MKTKRSTTIIRTLCLACALVLLPLGEAGRGFAIAIQCPLAGGNAVWQARVLFSTIQNNLIEFDDNCTGGSKRMLTINNKAESTNFILYPNPNNGNMLLDYSLNATDKGEIVIYDVAGKLIYKYGLDASASQIIISHTGFNNGIYFYKIIVNNKITQSDKLIIIK